MPTMVPLVAIIVALAGEIASSAPERVLPLTRAASFLSLPGMWGLQELSADTDLEDLDESFVLYLTERARFEAGNERGWVYFVGGNQLVVDSRLSEPEIADRLLSRACLCALEYEFDGPSRELETAAGAYRLTEPPSVDQKKSGIVRVEFQFEEEGQAGRARIRRLVCWSSADDTLEAIARALPGFAKLTRKAHPGFADPPMDDRPIGNHQPARQEPTIALADAYFGRAYDGSRPLRLDAPELVGTARPGLLTLFHQIRTGKKLRIDHSEYFEILDPYLRDLNRRHGICYRDPGYWP